jgi:lysophospholipase L1-like esterase
MKKLLILASIILSLTGPARADFVMQPNDNLAMMGDSITAQHLYSAFIEDYLLMCQPTSGQSVCQFGFVDEGVGEAINRLPFTVLPFKPTVVTTCYGTNDGLYFGLNDGIANSYRTGQTALVEALKKAGARVIIVGSPKCVDPSTFKNAHTSADAYNKNLAALAAIAKDVAAKEGVIYADVFDPMVTAIAKEKAQYGPTFNMGGDGFSPGPDGHLVMAYAFLKAMGCDGNIGTITVDCGAKQATGTPGQEITSYQNGTVTVKSTRYPFCFAGRIDTPDATPAAVLRNVPFNEELNRYLLVVKNLNAPKGKVTWGGATKEYTAAELEKGINLGAEFVQNNPFMGQFNAVDAAVHIQEDQEQCLTQDFMFQVPRFKTFIPGADATFDQLIVAGIAQHKKLFNTAAALVIPVTHTIKIESEP